MKQRSQNMSFMMGVTSDCIHSNPTFLEVPIHLETVTAFDDLLYRSSVKRQEMNTRIKAFTEYKENLKEGVIEKMLELSGILTVFAENTSNEILKNTIKCTITDLRRYSGPLLLQMSRKTCQEIFNYIGHLEPYNITQAVADSFKLQLDEFEKSLLVPRVSRVNSSRINSEFDQLIKEAYNELTKIDRFVNTYKYTNPPFHATYWKARKIIDTGARSYMVKGKIVDSTNEPIAGAVITFIPAAQEEPENGVVNGRISPIIKRTAKKGGFYLKSIPLGKYTVTISKKGFSDRIETVDVLENEITVINLELAPAGNRQKAVAGL